MESMRQDVRMQRLIAVCCLLLLLFAVLTPVVSGHTLALLVVLWSVILIASFVQLADVPEDHHPQQISAIAAFSPRPPPAL